MFRIPDWGSCEEMTDKIHSILLASKDYSEYRYIIWMGTYNSILSTAYEKFVSTMDVIFVNKRQRYLRRDI